MLESITAIAVALISASHLWDRRRTKSVEQKQDVLIKKISTNHGLEPHQYLELIGRIDHKVDLIGANLQASTQTVAGVDRRIDAHLNDPVAHGGTR